MPEAMKIDADCLRAWCGRFGPVRSAFIGSLLLSYAALAGSFINRDGILYIETARAIQEHGFRTLPTGLDWQFLSFLMAGLHALTGLSLEHAAHLVNALMLAGACALTVAITRRRLPEAAWAACLVVLAMPAYNGYRGFLLREFGFWFFTMLAFWLAMRWAESGRWREAIACQLALGGAVLFRLEAAAFFPALMLWQACGAPAGLRLRRALMIGCLPLAGALLAAALFGSGLAAVPGRVTYYLDAANPLQTLRIISEAASKMSEKVFMYKYSREEAGYVLFFGLLTIIPMKFIKMSGVFLVPLLVQMSERPARAWLSRWQPLPWAFFAYLLVLAAFVTHQFFLVGRYVSLLNLLAVPVAAAGLARLLHRYPRWRGLMLALALLTLAANVVSLSPRKTHVLDAAAWLASSGVEAGRVGVTDSRIAYYAGWKAAQAVVLDRDALGKALAEKRIDMAAVEAPRKEAGVEQWLRENRLMAVQRFANKAGDSVVIVAPADAQASPATTGRNRANTAPIE